MNTNNILQAIRSKGFLYAMIAVFALAILIGTFSAGMAVGYRKAWFSYAWGENYQRNFGRTVIDAHGTVGQVVKVDTSAIQVIGPDGVERSITLTDDTVIRRLQDMISLSDMHVGDRLVVIGEPTAGGQIQANFIRILPYANH